MNQNDINRLFTEKVTELIAQGFQINPATMSGHQGEIGKVDLRRGSEIIRVLLATTHSSGSHPDGITLIVGRSTDNIRFDRFDSLGNTIWNQNLQVLSETLFAKIADNYFTDMKTGEKMLQKRYHRWKNRQSSHRKDLPDAFKSAALRYIQRQPRMKTCKLSDITRVTRINRTAWGKKLPDLYGYEIEARGRTFTLKAPHADR